MRTAPLHIGIAGLGVGSRLHLPILEQLPGVRVVALACTHPQQAAAIAREHHIDHACGTLHEFFEQNLDAVILALPPKANELAIPLALEKGLPVLAEKPLASNGAEALFLCRQVRQRLAMVNYFFADIVAIQQLKRIIDTKEYGAVRRVALTWLVESYAQHHRAWSWKTDADQYGGVVSMLGSHMLYLAEWLFGPIHKLWASTDASVTASFAPPGSDPAPDTFTLFLVFESGSELTALISNTSPLASGHRIEVVFDEASAILTNPRSDFSVDFDLIVNSKAGQQLLHLYDPMPPGAEHSPYRALIQRFVDASTASFAQPSPQPDFSAGARVQILMDAVAASAKEHTIVDIPSFVQTRYSRL